jgi:hypothetical protein
LGGGNAQYPSERIERRLHATEWGALRAEEAPSCQCDTRPVEFRKMGPDPQPIARESPGERALPSARREWTPSPSPSESWGIAVVPAACPIRSGNSEKRSWQASATCADVQGGNTLRKLEAEAVLSSGDTHLTRGSITDQRSSRSKRQSSGGANQNFLSPNSTQKFHSRRELATLPPSPGRARGGTPVGQERRSHPGTHWAVRPIRHLLRREECLTRRRGRLHPREQR